MALTEVVDVKIELDALKKDWVPMSEINSLGNRPGERGDNLSPCNSVAQSQEKTEEQGKRNGPEPPKAAKGKAEPPLAQAENSKPSCKAPPAFLCDKSRPPPPRQWIKASVPQEPPWDPRFGPPSPQEKTVVAQCL